MACLACKCQSRLIVTNTLHYFIAVIVSMTKRLLPSLIFVIKTRKCLKGVSNGVLLEQLAPTMT